MTVVQRVVNNTANFTVPDQPLRTEQPQLVGDGRLGGSSEGWQCH
ncbi:MAG: hypothetical protein PHI31_17575 [Desulfuromonadaceae bacterium]|nr:hypothetical protein [Desulfuromonadaceae bacterium]